MIRTNLQKRVKETISFGNLDSVDDTFSVSGCALKWGVDSDGDLITIDSIRQPDPSKPVVIHYNHDTFSLPVGAVKSWNFTDEGLFYEGFIVNTEKGREIKTLVEKGVLNFCSIGARIHDLDFRDDVFVMLDLELYEISVVYAPAREGTSVALKSKDYKNLLKIKRLFEKLP